MADMGRGHGERARDMGAVEAQIVADIAVGDGDILVAARIHEQVLGDLGAAHVQGPREAGAGHLEIAADGRPLQIGARQAGALHEQVAADL